MPSAKIEQFPPSSKVIENIYVAMTAEHWAKGFSLAQAEAALKGSGSPAKRNIRAYGVVVWKLPPGAHTAFVDDLGTLHWSGPADPPETVKDTTKKQAQRQPKKPVLAPAKAS